LVDEHRSISHEHVAVIELEVQGIYQAPERHPALGTSTDEQARVAFALGMLRDERLQDCQVVCEDGRAIGCSSRLLEARWDWFKRTSNARTVVISEPHPVVMAFLEYIYTLDLVTALQHRVPVLTGLLMFAKQYEVPHLERLTVHALHGRLDEGTALGIYEVATLCECRLLQVRALKMVLVSAFPRPVVSRLTGCRRFKNARERTRTTDGSSPAGGSCPREGRRLRLVYHRARAIRRGRFNRRRTR
jgi:hypothetical protein